MACSVLVIGDGIYLSGIVGAAMKKQVINLPHFALKHILHYFVISWQSILKKVSITKCIYIDEKINGWSRIL